MTQTPVSVVIVSRGRPYALSLCLRAVARLIYPTYEVIVVADPEGIAAVERLEFSHMLKTVPFDEANISAARNRGVAQAAGQVVAFLDDDAVPEPRWLHHLVSAFDDPDVAAAGGYVRGRNGISFQWRGRILDQTGQTQNVALNSVNPTKLTPPPGWAVKTEGTNMAVRRDVLAQMGGFDPAFRFYLDETDLNMRLAKQGHATAIVPLAQVHHGYAASPSRRTNRAVLDVQQIAASTTVFLRKHCPEHRHAILLQGAFKEQRTRILNQMVSGLQEPRDVRRLIKGWHAGLSDGRARPLTHPVPLPPAQQGFRPFQSLCKGGELIISGHRFQAKRLRAQAARAASEGKTVSLFLWSFSTLYHSIRYHPDGYWEQTGGIWGKSDRTDPVFMPWRRAKRITHERNRIGAARFQAGETH